MKNLLLLLLSLGSVSASASTCKEVSAFLVGESGHHFNAVFMKGDMKKSVGQFIYIPQNDGLDVYMNVLEVYSKTDFYPYTASLNESKGVCTITHWSQPGYVYKVEVKSATKALFSRVDAFKDESITLTKTKNTVEQAIDLIQNGK